MNFKKAKRFISEIVIFLLVSIFFARLFFPEPSLFVTPDFGRSDALNLNIPAKTLLWESLRDAKLPLWEQRIGQGYPVLGEGIIGLFYIPNVIVMAAMPLDLAFPTIYLTTFQIAAFSMYCLLLSLKQPKFVAVFGALTYSFCASMIIHVQHINFLQAASILPLILAIILKQIDKPTLVKSSWLAFLLSQLIFTGFVQIYVYAIVIFSSVIVTTSLLKKKSLRKQLFIFAAICALSVALSAIQLMPSYEVIKQSVRTSGLSVGSILTTFPLKPQNLLSYLNPFILGSAADGTYNSANWSQKGIFWENTQYVGIIPLLLFITSLYFLLARKKNLPFLSFLLAAIISTLLSLGVSSPLHILYSFPPLSFFRVPARFGLFTQLFIVLLACIALTNILEKVSAKSKKTITLALIALQFFNIVYYWWGYNPIEPYKKATEKPELARTIENIDPNGRITSLDSAENWNKIFLKYGWQGKEQYFEFFKNNLDQNINILYNLNQFSAYNNLTSRRYNLQHGIIGANTKTEGDKISLDSVAKKLLDFANVKFFITSLPLNAQNIKPIKYIKKDEFQYILYQNTNAIETPRFYYDYQKADKAVDYVKFLESIDVKETLILEKDPPKIQNQVKGNSVVVTEKDDQHIQIKATTAGDGLLALANSYYPGWEAKIDSVNTEILPANINALAIFVPAGEHIIDLNYRPYGFKTGALISLIAHFALITLLFLKFRGPLSVYFRRRF